MLDTALLKDKKILGWVALFFIAGFVSGFPIGGSSLFNRFTAQAFPKEWREGQQGLINPLLGLNYPDSTVFEELKPLQNNLTLLVQKEISQGKASRVGLYFKDLTNAHWTAVNSTLTFAPASLIKIPMMMSYLKVAETNPYILDQQLQYVGPDQNKIEAFKPTRVMVPGQYYTVDELIRRMIVYSDNNAIAMLFNNLDKQKLGEIFSDLSITIPKDPNQPGDYITSSNFSRFFRILYNATYLSEGYSQKALDLLAQTDFKAGLTAGIPAGMTVAHKFGETPDVDQSGHVIGYELHDCGIVYPENHPYLLCVMTSGPGYTSLSGVIKDISSLVYAAVQNDYK
jgi:beta-lactamase class A